MQTQTLNVKGMTCGHCKAAVEGALQTLEGIKSVEINLDTGKVDVTYNEAKVTVRQMQEVVEEQGYDVV